MKFDDVFNVLKALLDGFNASVEIQSYSVIDWKYSFDLSTLRETQPRCSICYRPSLLRLFFYCCLNVFLLSEIIKNMCIMLSLSQI